MIDPIEWLNTHAASSTRPRNVTFTRAEVKEDGWRIVIHKQTDGTIKAYTRKGEDIWPFIQSRFSRLSRLCGEWILDGELVLEGGPASLLPTALRDPYASLRYVYFCIPVAESKILPDDWEDQRVWREKVAITLEMSWSPYSPNFPNDWTDEDFKQYTKDNGLEGVVLKATPFTGWYKIKPTHTVDMLVERIERGQGRHSERMGALVCRFHDDPEFRVRVGGGFSDNDREWWWSQDYRNGDWPVIEVEFQAVQTHSLQFPRFVRLREDKPVHECTIKQLEGIRRA